MSGIANLGPDCTGAAVAPKDGIGGTIGVVIVGNGGTIGVGFEGVVVFEGVIVDVNVGNVNTAGGKDVDLVSIDVDDDVICGGNDCAIVVDDVLLFAAAAADVDVDIAFGCNREYLGFLCE